MTGRCTLPPEIENLEVLQFDWLPGSGDEEFVPRSVTPPSVAPIDYFSEFQKWENEIRATDQVIGELELQRGNITLIIDNTLRLMNENFLKSFGQSMTAVNARAYASSVRLSSAQIENVSRVLNLVKRGDHNRETSTIPQLSFDGSTTLRETVGMHARLVSGLVELLSKIETELNETIARRNQVISIVRSHDEPIRAAMVSGISAYKYREQRLIRKREIAPIFDMRIIELETIVERKIHEKSSQSLVGPVAPEIHQACYKLVYSLIFDTSVEPLDFAFDDQVDFLRLQYELPNWAFLYALANALHTIDTKWTVMRAIELEKDDAELAYIDKMISLETSLLARLDFYKTL